VARDGPAPAETDEVPGSEPGPEPEAADASNRGPEPEPVVADEDEGLLQRRESAVIELEVTLTRKLKRALQDEQNDLLDRLRGLKGEPTAVRLLPDATDQVARYAKAALPLIEQAARAGVSFAGETLGHEPGSDSVPAVAELAIDAGTTIVEALRRRLEQAISMSADEDQAVLVESLGAAYREWKSQRIERLAGDVLAAAFSREPGTPRRPAPRCVG